MARITGRGFANRILKRLAKEAHAALTQGDRRGSENYELAWRLVYFAKFKRSTDPLRDAVHTMELPIEDYLPRSVPLEWIAPPPPDSNVESTTIWVIDGKNGRQWVASVVMYLEWRSGACWRPRFSAEREIYERAVYEVNHAFRSPDPPAPGPRTTRLPTSAALSSLKAAA